MSVDEVVKGLAASVSVNPPSSPGEDGHSRFRWDATV